VKKMNYRLFLVVVLAGTIMAPVSVFSQGGGVSAPTRWTQTESDKGYVVFEYNPMAKLAASHIPDRREVVNEVSCALARGEYESLQIAVHALAGDLKDIRIEVESDLDVKVYHRISPDVKQQLAKSEMTWMSWMDSGVYLQRGDVVKELPKGQSVNFWLTFHAPPEVSDGLHTGKIRIKPLGKPLTGLRLAVRVRPFRLQAPRAAFGMYFREDFLPQRFGSWSLKDQDALAIYRDMAEHGQNSVIFYMAGDFAQLPPRNSRMAEKSLLLARDAGLVHPEIPCLALQHNFLNLTRTQMQAAKTALAWLETQRREHGWPEIILYGRDEPPYRAPGLREDYGPLRALPIRLATAMSAPAAYAHGDLHDVWIVLDGHVTSEMQAEAHRLGAQLWTYSYRILREGFNPLRQRYYAGFYTWTHKLGGNFVWAYSHVQHGHAWWLPGSGEPMPITGWEARREGIDDYRYLQMLEDCVRASKSDPLAIEAASWLEALRVQLVRVDPLEVEAGKPLAIEKYDEIRAKAAGYIEKLRPSADRIEPCPVTYLKDEAAAFRGKSVDECLVGLASSQTSERRAAAWALFERDARDAKAVPLLAQALDDPDVRIPALHALESIGPEAYPAAPKVASLLSHPDGFVRLGATLALFGIIRPTTWNNDVKGYAPDDVSPYAQTVVSPLRRALGDSNFEVVRAAAHGLFYCGKAAAPALPDAMKMLGSEDAKRRDASLWVLSGMGSAAADAVPRLVELYAAAKGNEFLVARTLAAIGPEASNAVVVLEQSRTPENPYLADTCYALFCIRGHESDLKMMAGLLGDKSRPRGPKEWQDAAKLLIALGAKASPAAGLVRDRLPLLASESSLRRNIESLFLKRVEESAKPLRLMPN